MVNALLKISAGFTLGIVVALAIMAIPFNYIEHTFAALGADGLLVLVGCIAVLRS